MATEQEEWLTRYYARKAREAKENFRGGSKPETIIPPPPVSDPRKLRLPEAYIKQEKQRVAQMEQLPEFVKPFVAPSAPRASLPRASASRASMSPEQSAALQDFQDTRIPLLPTTPGPGQGGLSLKDWDALPNDERIARNVASYDSQRESIRSLRNARRAAEGSAPVGESRSRNTASTGIGGGLVPGASEATGSQSIARTPFTRVPVEEEPASEFSIEDQIAILGEKRQWQKMALDQEQRSFDRELKTQRSFMEQQEFIGEQVNVIAKESELGFALAPLLREFGMEGQAPRKTLVELETLFQTDDPGLQATVGTLQKSGHPAERQAALASLANYYREYLKKQGGVE